MSEPAVAVNGRGDLLEVLDAFGVWHRAVAVSEVEGTHENGRKVHDFPVVWVVVLNKRTAELLAAGDEPSRIPWPFDAVRPAPPGEPDDMTVFSDLLADTAARLTGGWLMSDDEADQPSWGLVMDAGYVVAVVEPSGVDGWTDVVFEASTDHQHEGA